MDKIRVLMINGHVSPDHDPAVAPMLRFLLESTDRFDVTMNEDFYGCTLETLNEYDLLFMAGGGRKGEGEMPRGWGSTAEKSLLDFVAGGKGIVLYHGGAMGGRGSEYREEFEKLSGYRYDFEHGGMRKQPKIDFLVKNCEGSHPIMDGCQPEWMTVQDDLFVNTIQLDPDIKVLCEVWDGEEDYDFRKMPKHRVADFINLDIKSLPQINTWFPVAWVHNYGKGRVFATKIGHGPDTIRRPNFCAIVVRGSEWAATGELTVPWLDVSGPRRRNAWPYYKDIIWRDYWDSYCHL